MTADRGSGFGLAGGLSCLVQSVAFQDAMWLLLVSVGVRRGTMWLTVGVGDGVGDGSSPKACSGTVFVSSVRQWRRVTTVVVSVSVVDGSLMVWTVHLSWSGWTVLLRL